ncbi:MAG: carboxypeptidase regulatory-like domain-containing protein [Bacteroidales bacterium]|nr:carboxypeptidase regulatory-like domain-containing protein [Bacteroidales bacterium]
MKKLLFSLLSLLMACGLAWADGVKVSGEITLQVGTYAYASPGYNDSVHLIKEGVELKAKPAQIRNASGSYVWTYTFESVEAGSYTLSYTTEASGALLSYSASVEVGNEDVDHPFTLKDDPTHVLITFYVSALNAYGGTTGLAEATVSCQKDEEVETKNTSSSGMVKFYCDTASLYTFKISKSGYKDTTFQTKAFQEIDSYYGIAKGKSLYITMREDLGDQVKLKGNVTIQGISGQDTIPGLYLAASWGDKTWVTEIKKGLSYEFSEIPTGKVVYRLTTSSTPFNVVPSKNWKFNNGKDTLHYEVVAGTNGTVTNNLTIVRAGVDVAGNFVDTLSTPGSAVAIQYAKVKLFKDGTCQDSAQTGYNGDFLLSGVQDGSYSLTFSKTGYATVTKEITIDMATVAIDSTVQLGNMAADPAEGNYVFYGQLYYYGSSYQTIYLNSAKVVMINAAGERIDSTNTDAQGNWEISVTCYVNTQFTFEATSPEINKATGTSTASGERNSVYIYCQQKTPELLAMENAQARQIEKSLKVELTWEWPDALQTGIPAHTYNINRIIFSRKASDAENAQSAGVILGNYGEVPPTRFIDSSSDLAYGKTYAYSIQIQYTVPVNGNKDVDANESLTVTLMSDETPVVGDSALLTLEVNDATMGTVEGARKYKKGTEVTIKAIPNEGYVFEAWKAGETEISKNAEYRFILNSDSTLKAFFAAEPVGPVEKDSFDLTLNVDTKMGMVEGAGKYKKGTEVTIKATANAGYDFVAWVSGNDTVAKTTEHKVVMTQDSTLTAVFVSNGTQVDSVVLTLNCDAKMGKVEGAGKYEKGSEVTIKATANTGYNFVAWVSGNDTVAKTAEYKLTLVSDSTLTAVFALKTANEELEQAAWSVYAESQTIVLRSKAACQYDVYNMAGALVKRAKTNANEYRIAVNNSGMYIIRRISATGISVKKVMVR